MISLENLASLLGLVTVTLVVLRSIWNYPVGLAMVALFCFVFFDARLYSDAILQIFFFVVQLYGWWNWSRSQAVSGTVMVVTLPNHERAAWAVGAFAAALLWGYGMARFTDAAFPWIDAAIAIVSVVAQILQSRRAVESWWLWIAVDVASVGLYAAKGLHSVMALYAVFLGLAIWGLIDWQRVLRRQAVA